MKKTLFVLLISFAAAPLLFSQDWYGVASVSVEDFPANGYYAATNSFPINTVINVTNMENNRTVKVTVFKNLDTQGLLLMLSKDAADAIGIEQKSVGRVNMSQVNAPGSAGIPDTIFTSGDPDHDPAAYVYTNGINPALFGEGDNSLANRPGTDTRTPDEGASAQNTQPPETTPSGDTYITNQVPPTYITNYYEYNYFMEPTEPRIPTSSEPQINPNNIVPRSYPLDQYPSEFYPRDSTSTAPAPVAPVPPVYQYQPQPSPAPQPPARDYSINPGNVIPPISAAPPPPQPYIYQNEIIPPISNAPPPAPAPVPAPVVTPAPAPSASGFSVPVIYSLEKGKYYIQVTAGPQAEGIESEIRKIGRSVPLAVQPSGTSEKPTYRLLIGPVNLGESGALLERYKTTYKDAFVRVGN